jgi:3-phytase
MSSARWIRAGAVIALTLAAALGQDVPAASTVPRPAPVYPVAETDPVGHDGDAADDPAFWFNNRNPARSMIIGTDKRGALETYDLDGHLLQRITGSYPNNVDVRGDMVVAADNQGGTGGGTGGGTDGATGGMLRIYRVAPNSRSLNPLAVVGTHVVAHGLCLYSSPSTERLYAFANAVSGRVEQWELTVVGSQVQAREVRRFDVGRAVEGCVADDASGAFYVAEERRGIWRYGAEPSDGVRRTLVDATSSRGHLDPDVEGLAIAGDRLYASSQASNDFTVYQRMNNRYLGRFRVSGHGAVDGCEDTDGIEVTTRPLGPAYPTGLFVCQDGYDLTRRGLPSRQNFKLVPLNRVIDAIGRSPLPIPEPGPAPRGGA